MMRVIKVMTSAEAKEITEFIKSGNTISAIKKWREVTGCGLLEAKTNVELIAEHHFPQELRNALREQRRQGYQKLNISVEIIDEE